MGDVISSHLDEAKREIITARTGEVMGEFGRLHEQQYAVALFNKVRFDVEGGGGPQAQLLHRKTPLENKSIFSGSLFQYLEENKKWRNRFLFIPDSYNINYYDNKASHDRGLHPKGTINCAGYKVLTSMEQYMDLISNSLPGIKAKVGSSPFLKCATQFPLILWHPYSRHYYFCVVTEKEQQKWHAVFQDCVRHTNDGLSEENKVQTPAFTDAVRLYRQVHGHYGTWDMMCGIPSQILSNLVMEGLLPELRELISPRLKGKMHDRQRNWMLISDAVYSLVQRQCQAQYEAVVQRCEAGRPQLEASIRTDMDQIITSKEHVTNKIRAVVLPKADKLLKVSIQPYISSILDALMEPTSRGFSEVRDVFFRELVDMSKNTLNEGTKETMAEHMEKISMLAFHPVKMQTCYEKVEQLSLEGLQQRFDVSSPSVFVQRAQILMREQMDDAVYTFEQILHQSLESQGSEGLCKTIQRCQDRVIKKFDYDSSTVRKRFFREALLQIFIPYMLKQLNPTCSSELPRFQELIFEDFSRFILVENIFEEVVLHSVMKDIMMAVKEAAVQRRHNLYRDSIVLTNSDPNLHLLGENPSIDWAGEYGAQEEADGAEEESDGAEEDPEADGEEAQKRRRMKQVVSMIQVEGAPVGPNESFVEVPGVDDILEEEGEEGQDSDATASPDSRTEKPTQSLNEISSPTAAEKPPALTNGLVLTGEEAGSGEQSKESPAAIESTVEKMDNVQGEDGQPVTEDTAKEQLPPTNQAAAASSEEALPLPQEHIEETSTKAVETEQGPASAPVTEDGAKEQVPPTNQAVVASSEEALPPLPEHIEETSMKAVETEQGPASAPVTEDAAKEQVPPTNQVVVASSEEVLPPLPEHNEETSTKATETEQGPAPVTEDAVKEQVPPTNQAVVASSEEALPPLPEHNEETSTKATETEQGPASAPVTEDVVKEQVPPTNQAVVASSEEALPPPPEHIKETSTKATETEQGPASAPVKEDAVKEQVPPTNQAVVASSEEALPPPPEHIEETKAAETEQVPAPVTEIPPDATADFPLPPHDDSGFQSPTSEGVGEEVEEEVTPTSTEAPQPDEGQPEVGTTVAAAPETATPPNDSETGDQ